MIYPDMCEVYIDALNAISPHTWYLPASRKKIYLSVNSSDSYLHNAFPWSRSPSCQGFTIGHGNARLGSSLELHDNAESFSFYEKMVSGTPMLGTCVDCYALSMAGDMISVLIGRVEQRHSHALSISSIEALDEKDDGKVSNGILKWNYDCLLYFALLECIPCDV